MSVLKTLLLLVLAALSTTAQGFDLLYVCRMDNTVVTYDVSLSTAANVQGSQQMFANSNLNTPIGLVFDSSGNLYVSNNPGSISKFDSSGNFLKSITGNLSMPYKIDVDSSGNIYVANMSSNSISKFDASGAFLSSISSNLHFPAGVAVSNSGNIYASNLSPSSISIFSSSGNFLSSITNNVSMPEDIKFDSEGNLFVANTNHTVSKYDGFGNYVSSITGNINTPVGLAFDRAGNLYVANYYYNSISKFNSSGAFQFSWSTGGVSPRGLAFSAVPEPSTGLILFSALCLFASSRRRRI
jgi:streptogramin lyase